MLLKVQPSETPERFKFWEGGSDEGEAQRRCRYRGKETTLLFVTAPEAHVACYVRHVIDSEVPVFADVEAFRIIVAVLHPAHQYCGT